MKQAKSTAISRHRLLTTAGLSTGPTLLARHSLFADDNGTMPTTANTATNAKECIIRPTEADRYRRSECWLH
jgi:hypothetical protein